MTILGMSENDFRENINNYPELFTNEIWQRFSANPPFTLSVEFAQQFDDQIKWDLLKVNNSYSKEFLEEFIDKINWNIAEIDYYEKEFLEKHSDKLILENLIKTNNDIMPLIEENFDKIKDDPSLYVFQRFTRDFIKRNKDDMNFDLLTKYGYLNQKIVEDNLDVIDLGDACYNPNLKLNDDFLEKHADKLDWTAITARYNLSDKFITRYQDYIDWNEVTKRENELPNKTKKRFSTIIEYGKKGFNRSQLLVIKKALEYNKNNENKLNIDDIAKKDIQAIEMLKNINKEIEKLESESRASKKETTQADKSKESITQDNDKKSEKVNANIAKEDFEEEIKNNNFTQKFMSEFKNFLNGSEITINQKFTELFATINDDLIDWSKMTDKIIEWNNDSKLNVSINFILKHKDVLNVERILVESNYSNRNLSKVDFINSAENISNYLFIDKFADRIALDKVNWDQIEVNKLNLDFFKVYANELDIDKLSLFKNITPEIIDTLSENRIFSKTFNYTEYFDNHNVDIDFLKKYQNKIDWNKISSSKNLNLEVIEEFKDKLNFSVIMKNEALVESFDTLQQEYSEFINEPVLAFEQISESSNKDILDMAKKAVNLGINPLNIIDDSFNKDQMEFLLNANLKGINIKDLKSKLILDPNITTPQMEAYIYGIQNNVNIDIKSNYSVPRIYEEINSVLNKTDIIFPEDGSSASQKLVRDKILNDKRLKDPYLGDKNTPSDQIYQAYLAQVHNLNNENKIDIDTLVNSEFNSTEMKLYRLAAMNNTKITPDMIKSMSINKQNMLINALNVGMDINKYLDNNVHYKQINVDIDKYINQKSLKDKIKSNVVNFTKELVDLISKPLETFIQKAKELTKEGEKETKSFADEFNKIKEEMDNKYPKTSEKNSEEIKNEEKPKQEDFVKEEAKQDTPPKEDIVEESENNVVYEDTVNQNSQEVIVDENINTVEDIKQEPIIEEPIVEEFISPDIDNDNVIEADVVNGRAVEKEYYDNTDVSEVELPQDAVRINQKVLNLIRSTIIKKDDFDKMSIDELNNKLLSDVESIERAVSLVKEVAPLLDYVDLKAMETLKQEKLKQINIFKENEVSDINNIVNEAIDSTRNNKPPISINELKNNIENLLPGTSVNFEQNNGNIIVKINNLPTTTKDGKPIKTNVELTGNLEDGKFNKTKGAFIAKETYSKLYKLLNANKKTLRNFIDNEVTKENEVINPPEEVNPSQVVYNENEINKIVSEITELDNLTISNNNGKVTIMQENKEILKYDPKKEEIIAGKDCTIDQDSIDILNDTIKDPIKEFAENKEEIVNDKSNDLDMIFTDTISDRNNLVKNLSNEIYLNQTSNKFIDTIKSKCKITQDDKGKEHFIFNFKPESINVDFINDSTLIISGTDNKDNYKIAFDLNTNKCLAVNINETIKKVEAPECDKIRKNIDNMTKFLSGHKIEAQYLINTSIQTEILKTLNDAGLNVKDIYISPKLSNAAKDGKIEIKDSYILITGQLHINNPDKNQYIKLEKDKPITANINLSKEIQNNLEQFTNDDKFNKLFSGVLLEVEKFNAEVDMGKRGVASNEEINDFQQKSQEILNSQIENTVKEQESEVMNDSELEVYKSYCDTVDEFAERARLSVRATMLKCISNIEAQNKDNGIDTNPTFNAVRSMFDSVCENSKVLRIEDINKNSGLHYYLPMNNGDVLEFTGTINESKNGTNYDINPQCKVNLLGITPDGDLYKKFTIFTEDLQVEVNKDEYKKQNHTDISKVYKAYETGQKYQEIQQERTNKQRNWSRFEQTTGQER